MIRLFRRNRPGAVAAPTPAPALDPLPRRIPQRPFPIDVEPAIPEAEVRELATLLIRDAIAACRHAALVAENARLMDEYAARYPMKRRAAIGNGGDFA